MKTDRLFEMVYLLLHKGTMTAGEIAQHFEVSVRTVLRDVETLSMAGVPVYTSQGKGGGISLPENYVMDKAAISEEEQGQILFALQSLLATGYLDPRGVLAKLRAFFGKEDADWIEVDFSRWGGAAEDREKFELLKKAILQQRALSFTYVGTSGKKEERTVFPLCLLFKAKSWYLKGFCQARKDHRTFKLNRILCASLSEDFFTASEFSPPPAESKDSSADALVSLRMRFAPHAAYRAYDEFEPAHIVQNEDGSLYVSATFPEDEWLYGFLLSLGTAAEVLEPQHVRDALKRRAEAIINCYKKTEHDI